MSPLTNPNPTPFLPWKLQKVIHTLRKYKAPQKLVFLTIGFFATLWFLIRVIPKPSRAGYPCMQAMAPMMSAFVVWLTSTGGAAFAFSRYRKLDGRSKKGPALAFLGLSLVLIFISTLPVSFDTAAKTQWNGKGYFTPNQPMGIAQGIFPGRVTWSWDPDATNENCTNSSNNNGYIDAGDDAWFMAQNNNPAVIDTMVAQSLLALTEAGDQAQAWDLIFKFFNNQHGNGNVGYTPGEKILIKINATSAYGGVAEGGMHSDMSRTDDIGLLPYSSETNPYLVLSVLHQLVDVAGVSESKIYIGDPARNIFKEFYDLWHNEFPNIHYLGNNLIYTDLDVVANGRTPVEVTTTDRVFWSDEGSVMTTAVTDKLFTLYDSISYLINIPTMKAHSTAGITLAAKNHFGSFTRQWAMQLHPGLFDDVDNPIRTGYGLYRVQTDIMMHKQLGGKTLLFIVDGLYPGEDAVIAPDKWQSFPFANDWCSSIYMSQDPVAIESVCHDFLRTEYNGPTVATSRPNWFGVDDYLHQAADSSNWPAGILYDPDNDGILIASLGVHEHWNDSIDKQYTRDLGTGDGIELIKLGAASGMEDRNDPLRLSIRPNPSSGVFMLFNPEPLPLEYAVYDLFGNVVRLGSLKSSAQWSLDLRDAANGEYLLSLKSGKRHQCIKLIKF